MAERDPRLWASGWTMGQETWTPSRESRTNE